jgi:hypothetical protein
MCSRVIGRSARRHQGQGSLTDPFYTGSTTSPLRGIRTTSDLPTLTLVPQ